MWRGHRTRLNNQLVCLWSAPSPVYKGVEEGEGRPHGARPRGGFLLLVVGFPLPHMEEEKKERERERRKAPPKSDWAWGARASHLAASSSLPPWPIKAH